MRVGLRVLQPTTEKWLRGALQQGVLTRTALARGLCEQDGWRNQRGRYCESSARKALPRLADELGLELPASQGERLPAARSARPTTPLAAFRGSLQELGPVQLELARTAAQRRHCAQLLASQHPCGRGSAPGCRLSYLVRATCGPVGVLSFVAAPFRLGPRDRELGWDDRTRGARIPLVLHNDRFLVGPQVVVPHLASHVLGQAQRRVAADWKQLHGVAPVLLETCVAPARKGTSYKAAGWQRVGRTQGRPPGADEPVPVKTVWWLGLTHDWRTTLLAPPDRPLGRFPALELPEEASWAEREFQRSDLPDGRLRERLVRMGRNWERQGGRPLPSIFPHPAEQRAAYRFLHNDKVTGADILQPHREALLERIRQASTVLLVQDTTTLNYTGLKDSTEGLGPLQKRSDTARGLFVHAAVAFTPGRRPLGVSGLESWARPEQAPAAEGERESQRWLRGFEQGRELGRRSPSTRVIVVGDRESDIYELLASQHRHRAEAGLVVRVHAGRQRQVQVQDPVTQAAIVRKLQEQPDFEQPVLTGRKVFIDSQGGKRARAARTAETELRIAQVDLQPPKSRPQDGPVPVWVVQVREPQPPPGEEPLEWLLVSSEGGASAEWAERIVGWYEARWSIEEFFRLLKSGTRIEDRRLQTATALQKCLVFDAITAWRVFSLDRYARDRPDTPADQVLTATEREVIARVVQAEDLRPPAERQRPLPPDIRSWVVLLARMTGWQPSRRRPLPGNEVLWRAYVQLQTMVRLLEAQRASPNAAPPPIRGSTVS